MAKVGEQLLQPESGWKRYDDTDSNISYIGDWIYRTNDSNIYNNNQHTTKTIGNKVMFNFIGTKLRIIATRDSSTNVGGTADIYIDGIKVGNYINSNTGLQKCTLFFEYTTLINKEHYVEIIVTNVSNYNYGFNWDCIDINENGILKSYTPYKYLIQDKNNILYSLNGGGMNDSIPIMTSDTTPSGVASASGVANGYYSPFKVFNGTNANNLDCWASNTPQCWLQYDFGVGNEKQIINYSIEARNDSNLTESLKSWEFQGSNDGISWETLDTKTDIKIWVAKEVREYDFQNGKKYRFYRINIITNHGNGYSAIAQLKMFEKISSKLNKLGNDLTEELFKNKGMSDPTILQKQQVNQIEDSGISKECEPFELTDWLKKDECKLLVYTDDLEKKECEMVYNCEPYKPIDKLKENNTGKFDILMKEF